MVELIAPRNYCGVENLVPSREQTPVLQTQHTISMKGGAWVVLPPKLCVNWREPKVIGARPVEHWSILFCIAVDDCRQTKKGR